MNSSRILILLAWTLRFLAVVTGINTLLHLVFTFALVPLLNWFDTLPLGIWSVPDWWIYSDEQWDIFSTAIQPLLLEDVRRQTSVFLALVSFDGLLLVAIWVTLGQVLMQLARCESLQGIRTDTVVRLARLLGASYLLDVASRVAFAPVGEAIASMLGIIHNKAPTLAHEFYLELSTHLFAGTYAGLIMPSLTGSTKLVILVICIVAIRAMRRNESLAGEVGALREEMSLTV